MKTFSCVIIQLLLLLLICGVAIAEDNVHFSQKFKQQWRKLRFDQRS